MSTLFASLSRFEPYALGLLRMVTGYTFLLHGMQKLFGVPASDKPMPELLSFLGFGGVLELVLGLMVLIGFKTRLAAFLASGMMAVGYFVLHAKLNNFWLPLVNKGDAAVLYSFIYLYLACAGAGAWSLDNKALSNNSINNR